jgi:1,4-alpha-glucan branching enzyme
MKKLSLLTGLFLLLVLTGFSQVITVTPALPTDQDSVVVIFDAAQGNAGLAGYTGDVYAHTGVITNLSTGPSDWKYVITAWGENTEVNKLTSLGNNLWKLVIRPSIRSFYFVPTGEVIQKLAFVFRNADGSMVGKTADGGDIFYDVFPSSINVQITNPSTHYLIADFNDTFIVEASSLLADSTLLFIDGLKVAATNTNQISYTITASAYGTFQVVAMAKTATESAYDTLVYYVRPPVTVAELPAGMKDGINYLDETSVLLSLYAPLKHFAYVIGDFNNWQPNETSYMKQTPDGKRYWIQIDNLVPGKEYIYQYFVDGTIRIGDPFADKVSDPWNDQYITSDTYPNMLAYPVGKTQGIATVLQTAQQPYAWTSTSYVPPANSDLIIYELLLRDFSEQHSFQSLIDTLGYLKRLGINAIELMPVSEFEGNLSWGYNPNYYFAVDKYYGNANNFKKLVDICHQNGIAVIMDVVYNHAFGTSPYVMLYWDAANNRPSAESPFYNPIAKHDYNVGYDMNHESPDSKNYISRVLKYWLEEYHVDGYRFDLSKGFTQNNTLGNTGAWGAYDASRIAILSAYHDTIVKANPKAILILEHFADNSEEKELASDGMMLWGNMNYNYGEAAMGYTSTSDLSWGSYKSRGWSQPNLVTYMESHDEEREMYRCITNGKVYGSYSIKDTVTALKRAGLTATFLLTIPGPKMIWQFGERGYDYSINYPSGTSDSRLSNKPPRWDYMSNPERVQLYNQYADILKLRTNNPLFRTSDFTLDVAGAVKKITLRSEGKTAIVLGNFDVISSNVSAGFPHTGIWYDYITGDSLVLTDVNLNYNLIFKAGEYRLYLSEKYNPYGIAENKKEPFSVTVSPNPVSDLCVIDISTTQSTSCEVKDFSLLGSEIETVYSGSIHSHLQFPWTPKGKGIHLLKVRIGNQQVVRKVVVE